MVHIIGEGVGGGGDEREGICAEETDRESKILRKVCTFV